MKQHSQINITRGSRKLHYMVEFNDTLTVEATHGDYSYRPTNECIQFIRNQRLIDNFENNNIYNTVRNINTWTVDTGIYTNLYIPRNITQRKMVLYIPRYSMESFFDKEVGSDHELQLSGIRYIITAYVYIAGVKVVLGSYLFDLGSARATTDRLRYKMDDFQLCVDFYIIDPVALTYDDAWAPFRNLVCLEPENINNTGSVIHVDLDPVILSDDGDYYIRSSEFLGGITSLPFSRQLTDYLRANLTYDGDAVIDLMFNDVYDNDIELYMAETYGLWELDEEGHIVERDGLPVPRPTRMIFELIIRDKENVYFETSWLTPSVTAHTFRKSVMAHGWDWYKDGLIMQGSVEIYDIMDIPEEWINDSEALRDHLVPIADVVTNEVPLNKETYRFLVPFSDRMQHGKRINLDLIDMNEYDVSVVNKIHKEVVKINRPDDYKSNIVRPVFIRTEPLGDITIHPAVSENIDIKLNKYKSKVDLFYLRIEGVDFIEIGRTPVSVVFGIDGNLLPNEVTEGLAYILDQDFKLVTTTHYKYEQ